MFPHQHQNPGQAFHDSIAAEMAGAFPTHFDDAAERAIVSRLVSDALSRAWTVSVSDGEEWTVIRSASPAVIAAAMASTSDDTLAFTGPDGSSLGRVWLVYGNGCDLISDSTTGAELNSFLDPIIDWSGTLA